METGSCSILALSLCKCLCDESRRSEADHNFDHEIAPETIGCASVDRGKVITVFASRRQRATIAGGRASRSITRSRRDALISPSHAGASSIFPDLES